MAAPSAAQLKEIGFAVEEVAKVRDQRRVGVDFADDVNQLRKAAEQWGLEEEQLKTIVDTILHSDIAMMHRCSLILCLFSKTGSISEELVIDIILWICSKSLAFGKKGGAIPSRLAIAGLNWVVGNLEYGIIDQPGNRLSCLYAAVFNLMQRNNDLITVCCRVLTRLTRSMDVTFHRVNILFDMLKLNRNNAPLESLLSQFKAMRPEMVTQAVHQPTQQVFSKLPPALVLMLDAAKARNGRKDGGSVDSPTTASEFVWNQQSSSVALRKNRTAVLAQKPSYCNLGVNWYQENKVTLLQIKSVRDFVNELDRIEFPSQASCMLNSPIGWHLISLWPSDDVASRLSYWAYYELHHTFLSPEAQKLRLQQQKPKKRIKAIAGDANNSAGGGLGASVANVDEGMMLCRRIVEFVDHINEGIPAVSNFVAKYMSVFGMLSDQHIGLYQSLLMLVMRSKLVPYNSFALYFLRPIRNQFMMSGPVGKATLFFALTSMLENMILLDAVRPRELFPAPKEEMDADSILQSIQETSIMIRDLAREALLHTNDSYNMMTYLVMDFYNMLLNAQLKVDFRVVLLPDQALFNQILYSSNSTLLTMLLKYFVKLRRHVRPAIKANPDFIGDTDDIFSGEVVDNFATEIGYVLFKKEAFLEDKILRSISDETLIKAGLPRTYTASDETHTGEKSVGDRSSFGDESHIKRTFDIVQHAGFMKSAVDLQSYEHREELSADEKVKFVLKDYKAMLAFYQVYLEHEK